MKLAVTAAAFACLLSPLASAQTAPAPAAAAAKFTLDTPIEAIVADPRGKAVIDADLPGTTTHAMYDSFKSMSLRQVQPLSAGRLTDEMMKKVEASLAAIK
jgi:hypothetical protein